VEQWGSGEGGTLVGNLFSLLRSNFKIPIATAHGQQGANRHGRQSTIQNKNAKTDIKKYKSIKGFKND